MTSAPPPLVLVVRPEPAASALAHRLRREGYRAAPAPTHQVERVARLRPDDLQDVEIVALTSAEAARAAVEDLGPETLASLLRTARTLCVGDATAAAATAAGFPNVMSVDADGARLEAGVVALAPEGAVAHLRGADVAHDLRAGLSAQGVRAVERVLYRAAPLETLASEPLAALAADEVDGVIILSARAAEQFRALALQVATPRFVAVCISARAAAPVEGWVSAVVAPTPTLEAVVSRLHEAIPLGPPGLQ